MNRYLQGVTKLEFVVTNACTGRCIHCSQGAHTGGTNLSPALAGEATAKLAQLFPLKTVLAFGGEPLLCPETVFAILAAAKDHGVPGRQVITNGYFSKHPDTVRAVAKGLAESGANQLLVSVDAFHAACLPMEAVREFALAAASCGIPTFAQPAWLVSPTADNPYNRQTRALLAEFSALGVPETPGNIIFPEGNARTHLAAYFTDHVPKNPYIDDPYALRCISVDANGDVLGGNLYRRDILELVANYAP